MNNAANSRILHLPLDDSTIAQLHAGDPVALTGTVYTARDAAHRRFHELLLRNEPLPVDLRGELLYYTGPTPPRPGTCIGSAEPTTSGRMDGYTPLLMEKTGLPVADLLGVLLNLELKGLVRQLSGQQFVRF